MDYSGGPNVISDGRQGIICLEDVKIEAEVREERKCYTTAFKNGERGPEPRNMCSHQKLEKTRKLILP